MTKILVIESNPDMRQVVLNVLRPEKYILSSASDGQEAINKTKHDRPDIVLLDFRLPDIDSIEVLCKIKKVVPKAMIIILCGFGDIESAVGAIKKGAFNYICKPFKIDEVLAMVRNAINIKASGAADPGVNVTSIPIPFQEELARSGARLPTSSTLKYILTLIIILGISAEIALLIFSYLSTKIKNESFTVPYSNPTAITYDGTHLWITDWLTQTFYQHNVDKNFSLAHTYYIQDSHPTGIAFDGKYLWSSNAWESLIYKHNIDASLTVVETFQSPCPEPSGLFWDGVYFWICDMGHGKIYKTRIAEEGLIIIKVHDSPGNNPVGIFFDGDHYWIGDANTNQIHKLNKNFTVAGVYITKKSSNKDGYRLASIGWDGKSIWTCSDENQVISRDALQTLKKVTF